MKSIHTEGVQARSMASFSRDKGTEFSPCRRCGIAIRSHSPRTGYCAGCLVTARRDGWEKEPPAAAEKKSKVKYPSRSWILKWMTEANLDERRKLLDDLYTDDTNQTSSTVTSA